MEAKKNRSIKVAIIGMGLIGQERLSAVKKLSDKGRKIEVCGIYDPYCEKKAEIEKKFKIEFLDDLDSVYDHSPNWVLIAVPHDRAFELVKLFLKKGFNVLVEKPLGRTLKEAEILLNCVVRAGQLWVGFNYRFFDGIAMALEDFSKGKFGKIISVNMVLGHGCYPQIKKTWKLDPKKSGGGCLIDPGIHLLDLCRIISRDKLKIKNGVKWSGFWKTGIEEECHFLFEAGSFLINLQLSIVRWRSTFRIEINGQDGYGIVSGRGKSYGNQTYIYGPRWGWQDNPSQKDSERLINETTGEDVFAKELEALFFPESRSFIKPCSALEAVENMRILEKCRAAIDLK